MPEFSFVAKDKLGNTINGSVEASDILLASNNVGQMGYVLVEISPAGFEKSPAQPAPPQTFSPPPPADILIADVEKRRKVEQDLAKMGMTPVEIQRLLNADAKTAEAKEPIKRRGIPTNFGGFAPPPLNSLPALPAKGKKAEVQQKRASKANELESFAAQLAASNLAKKAMAPKEIVTINLDLPAFRASSVPEVQQAATLLREASGFKRREKYAEAIAKCREALTLVPSDAAALELYGDLMQGVARTPEALAAYRRATEADVKRASAERKYGDLVMRQQEWPDDDPEEVPKNPVVAAVFSALFPGAGQLHNLEYVKGGVMMGIALLCVGAWFVFGQGKEAYQANPVRNVPTKTTSAKKVKLNVEWGAEMPLLISRVCYLVLMIGSAADAYAVAKRNFRR